MTEVLFYHLTESLREAALPPLVEKSLERGWRVAIQTASEAERDRLDELLWTFRADSFVPHGLDSEDGAERQPVLLTATEASPNGADIRFFVEGAEVSNVSDYKRVVVMFDGHDVDELTRARGQWKALRGGDHQLTYWQQGSDGRWQKKA
ncbi:DNA polymerase III subunit chi [Martelella endophytica]|uniref:DNA polymerase III subunit chi n=1 Tax=Martelella endophytica TaxID=1486262 RepID=A0A0D5LRR3_MAREN|nr:DNA polymerase III subunit chi [Martelella endophytica]AJY46645.1 DNA polymerase III subunit chi [Martelella endophytica]